MSCRKKIVDGRVGVVYSKDYGGGWYTAEVPIELVLLPELVDYITKFSTIWRNISIEQKKKHLIRVIELFSTVDISLIQPELESIHNLGVEWVPENSLVKITAIDGKEKVEWVKIEKGCLIV